MPFLLVKYVRRNPGKIFRGWEIVLDFPRLNSLQRGRHIGGDMPGLDGALISPAQQRQAAIVASGGKVGRELIHARPQVGQLHPSNRFLECIVGKLCGPLGERHRTLLLIVPGQFLKSGMLSSRFLTDRNTEGIRLGGIPGSFYFHENRRQAVVCHNEVVGLQTTPNDLARHLCAGVVIAPG